MVDNHDPDSRRGLDFYEYIPTKYMVPVCFQSRLGYAGHHVEEMEPVDSANCDHYNISTPSGPERMARIGLAS